MGATVSGWQLAQAVARRGQMGVVSGTAMDRIMACRLQQGDPGGHYRRILAGFPVPEVADRLLERYSAERFARSGRYRPIPMFGAEPCEELLELAVAAAYAEVALAKEGHDGPVGINLLEKIQAPTLPLLYGAMLAGVDWVLMGAGIPRDIPAHLDRLVAHQPATLKLQVVGGPDAAATFDPGFLGVDLPPLRRPGFIAIVGSSLLARSLARAGGFDGLVIEGHIAGGHNALPRRGDAGDPRPVYGKADTIDVERIAALGLPFWLAGGYGHAGGLDAARELGAVGIQVGTLFAFCTESNFDTDLRHRALAAIHDGTAQVITDGRCSPTGFPFKVMQLAGTQGAPESDTIVRKPCIHGYLRQAYRDAEGALRWRCSAEPEHVWASKGGDPEQQPGRRCLCNALAAAVGCGRGWPEQDDTLPVITAGTDLSCIEPLVADGSLDYSADQVIDMLLAPAS
ncbi:MAG: nitronate monooxygenase [Planctomycetota bacterium]